MDTRTIQEKARAGDPFAHAGFKGRKYHEERTLAFWRERGDEVTRMTNDVYRVPSFSRDGIEYVVDYDVERCTCPSGTYRPGTPCKHVLVVGILRAKEQMRRRRNFLAALAADEGEQEE